MSSSNRSLFLALVGAGTIALFYGSLRLFPDAAGVVPLDVGLILIVLGLHFSLGGVSSRTATICAVVSLIVDSASEQYGSGDSSRATIGRVAVIGLAMAAISLIRQRPEPLEQRLSLDGLVPLLPDGARSPDALGLKSPDDLGHHESLLRSVLDNTFDAVITIDESGTVTLFSGTGERMFGLKSEEVVGRNVKLLMPEPYHSEHDGYIAKYLTTGAARIIGVGREVRGQRKDGSTFPIDLAVTEFRLDDRRYFVGIVRDISDRKNLEEQLHQSQKLEAIGQLAGGVAHDFNNLLTVITGFSEILTTRLTPDDDRRGMVDNIKQAAERASSLTKQLLAFSRKQILEPRIVELNAIVDDTKVMLSRLIGEHIRLSTTLTPFLPKVRVDAGQIAQVIVNLAVNARDAMTNGGDLSIETHGAELDGDQAHVHVDARPGRYVVLSVADNGSGIPAHALSRLFEPFYTTKGVGRGTGLGLAVVHGIVKQSGGFVLVETSEGAGSTFDVYLPAVTEAAAPLPEPSSSGVVRGSETIMLVEDENAVRELAVKVLEDYGYRVLSAAGANGALRLLEITREPIDLLVTDVVMPDVSGRQLAGMLTARSPRTRVLFVSGYADDEISQRGLLRDDVAFLAKPFTPTALALKVREVLDAVPKSIDTAFDEAT